ncbi:cytochrome P450 [Xylariaceae sp. FL0594]|nr:cytochrome P450 [Xylariaceae sp. FL0594]
MMAFSSVFIPLRTLLEQDFKITACILVITYASARCIYLLNFHPLSKFSGPRIAAVSNIWYAYHWLSRRWPWAVEAALKQYGDIVRIAPNELAFGSPQASIDIYGAHDKSLEKFIKRDIHDYARDKDGGIIWQQDPVKHRQIAKRLAPAFSPKATQAKDPILHRYADLFVDKMRLLGGSDEGVSIPTWVQWLSMDIAAEMAYHHQVNCMRDEKDSDYLRVVLSFNKFSTMTQVLRRFPWLSLLRYLVLPVSLVGKLMQLRQQSLAEMKRRLALKGATEHIDYFEQLLPADGRVPEDPEELLHLSKISTQLMFAGYLPPSDWYYGTFYHLLHNRTCLETVTREIRDTFQDYSEITPQAVVPLPYLTACLKEALRCFNTSALINGMPVYSPGATVDGKYISKGTTCQFSAFSVSRSPRYFRHPLQYRPERWLPPDHRLYDHEFASDDLEAFMPFNHGPGMCSGKEIAWWQARLVIAKVLWSFDLELVPHQDVRLERDLTAWGYWIKPELKAIFRPVDRKAALKVHKTW